MKKNISKKYNEIAFHQYFSSSIWFLFNIIDTYLVASISQGAVAALGLLNPLILVVVIILHSISSGSGIVVSHAHGGKKKERVKKQILVGGVITSIITIFLFIFAYLTKDYAFNLFSASNDIKQYFIDYFEIWVYTILFIGIDSYLGSVSKSIDLIKIITRIDVIGMVINIILSYILINGLYGFTEMGVQGAALGSLISLIIMTLAKIYILNKRDMFIMNIKMKYFLPLWDKVKIYIIPNLIGGAVFPIAMTVTTVIISTYNDAQIAAFTLALKFDLMWLLVNAGIGIAFSILAGQEIGNKNTKNVQELFKHTYKIGTILAISIFISSFFIGDFIGAIFFTSQDTIDVFKHTIPFIVSIYFFWNITGSIASLFHIISKPKISTIIGVTRTINMFIIFPFISSYFWGYQGILYGYVIGIMPSVFLAIYFLKTKQNIIQFKLNKN